MFGRGAGVLSPERGVEAPIYYVDNVFLEEQGYSIKKLHLSE